MFSSGWEVADFAQYKIHLIQMISTTSLIFHNHFSIKLTGAGSKNVLNPKRKIVNIYSPYFMYARLLIIFLAP